MAQQVFLRTLIDSADLAVIHVYIKGDSSGDVTKSVIYDMSAATTPNPAWQIVDVKGVLNGFSGHIAFDQTTESVAEVLPSGYPFHWNTDVDSRSPIFNPAAAGTTGDVTFTSTGLTTGKGFFILTLRKKRTSTTNG